MNYSIFELLEKADAFEKRLPARPAIQSPGTDSLASFIDHTLLKPEATPDQIDKLCREAVEYQFASVCINPIFVAQAARNLKGSPVKVCTVIGFPLGATPRSVKVYETRDALAAGAQEIDAVIPIGLLKGAGFVQVFEDIQAVTRVSHAEGALVKVILEMGLLTRREKIIGCLLSQAASADYVKTSTGFGPGGATIEDVELMRRIVGNQMGVKAAGGIRTLDSMLTMIQAGASRIGTSAGVKIIQQVLARESQA